MCGIIGYVGKKPAKDILIDGLAKLEYRGYDSAGIALLNDDDTLTIKKKAGRPDSGKTAEEEAEDIAGFFQSKLN